MPPFLQTHFDLTNFSSFHTKASSKYFFDITNKSDIENLPRVLSFAKKENIPVIFIGGGSNILFAFEEFQGIIIRSYLKGYSIEGNTLTSFSGELVSPIAVRLEKEYGNPCFIPWIGLPGTIGGAVVGNAGCFGLETGDILTSVEVYDTELHTYKTYSKDDLEYRYRHSKLKDTTHLFMVSATFDITPPITPPTDARLFRKDKQPGGWSCGSFFANPEGTSAGKLIDEVGLKGTAIGGIRISERHGNFFLNDGTATYKDVLELKELAKNTVREKFNIELHEEVRIITNR